MSEQQNIQIVQQAYDAFKAGDIHALLNLFSENIEWRTPDMPGVPYSGNHNGREEVAQYFAVVDEVEEVLQFEQREYIAQGDKVVTLVYYAGKVKSTGRTYEGEGVHVCTVRDGKIVKFQEFSDTAATATAFQGALSA